MEKEILNATEVASEIENVVTETASINNLNSNEMQEKENAEVAQTTRIVVINGEEKNFILAHTDYGMEQPKDPKNLKGAIDTTKLMPCTFNFAKPDVFWKEGVELKDEENNVIASGTENVLVICPTGDTYWRFDLEEKFVEPKVHDFASLKDYATAIGTTNLYSRGLSNTEKVGVAALATGNEACKTVFLFAKKHKMNITTAKLYLDCTMKPTTIIEMTIGVKPKTELTLGRKEKDAEKLYEGVTKKFGKNADKRYIVRAINTLLRKGEYSLKQMREAIKMVTEVEKVGFEGATSEEKQSEITKVFTQHLVAIKNSEHQKEAA